MSRLWGSGRPSLVFGDLLLPPPSGAKQVLVYDKGTSGGFTGALGGFRRNAEAVYLMGAGWPSGLGGRSCVLTTRASAGGNLARSAGHPHAKPLDVLETLIAAESRQRLWDRAAGLLDPAHGLTAEGCVHAASSLFRSAAARSAFASRSARRSRSRSAGGLAAVP